MLTFNQRQTGYNEPNMLTYQAVETKGPVIDSNPCIKGCMAGTQVSADAACQRYFLFNSHDSQQCSMVPHRPSRIPGQYQLISGNACPDIRVSIWCVSGKLEKVQTSYGPLLHLVSRQGGKQLLSHTEIFCQ